MAEMTTTDKVKAQQPKLWKALLLRHEYLTHKMIAEKSGIAEGSMSQILTGKRLARLKSIVKINDALEELGVI